MKSDVHSVSISAIKRADVTMRDVVLAAPVELVHRAWAPERWLPGVEADAIFRHARAEDRASRFAAWGLARVVLGLVRTADPATLAITRDRTGRPHLADHGGPDFNLSHADGWVAVGLSRTGRIGVDVEQDRACTLWNAVAADFLPLDALTFWYAQSEADRAATALRQWCMREAVLKATGEGLFGDLRTIDLPLTAGHGHISRGAQDYRVGALDLAEGHCLGFAIASALSPQILLLCEGDGCASAGLSRPAVMYS